MGGNNYDSTSNGNDKLDEGKLNTLNTVALLCILIATVTFTAGTNHPDGFYQEGQQIGKALGNKQTAFKIFSITNDIAFFASLFVVLRISNISPENNKALDVLLSVNTAIMWMAVICMAAAYLAARWVSLQHRQRTRWCTVLLGSFTIIIAVIPVCIVKLRPYLLESTKSTPLEENTKAHDPEAHRIGRITSFPPMALERPKEAEKKKASMQAKKQNEAESSKQAEKPNEAEKLKAPKQVEKQKEAEHPKKAEKPKAPEQVEKPKEAEKPKAPKQAKKPNEAEKPKEAECLKEAQNPKAPKQVEKPKASEHPKEVEHPKEPQKPKAPKLAEKPKEAERPKEAPKPKEPERPKGFEPKPKFKDRVPCVSPSRASSLLPPRKGEIKPPILSRLAPCLEGAKFKTRF